MPQSAKYFGNVFGIPTGGPDDDPFTNECWPDGAYGAGYQRRSLPSERFIDEIISPMRADRESGYLPGMTEDEIQSFEGANRALQRSMSITEGNVTGSFTGPPDRVRRNGNG